ncbi:hypothetical protein QAD02_007968 [Eretmocerus hayati]|uniref:Uncharacterized protein n=1 Tax=Eretmocerus hayati TaxID=131215 RepID=A0ACC2N5E2_9HYME|nr:hypothetical protein QAD02_007968 [Eretmocerus hayati]
MTARHSIEVEQRAQIEAEDQHRLQALRDERNNQRLRAYRNRAHISYRDQNDQGTVQRDVRSKRELAITVYELYHTKGGPFYPDRVTYRYRVVDQRGRIAPARGTTRVENVVPGQPKPGKNNRTELFFLSSLHQDFVLGESAIASLEERKQLLLKGCAYFPRSLHNA